tara:strand:+ start:4995 stop:5285 length:291 start_codon:yes stop_codon:yes gene_type:complete
MDLRKKEKMNFREYVKLVSPEMGESGLDRFDEYQLTKSHFNKLSEEQKAFLLGEATRKPKTFEARGFIVPETFEDDIEDFLIDRRRVALTLIGEYA